MAFFPSYSEIHRAIVYTAGPRYPRRLCWGICTLLGSIILFLDAAKQKSEDIVEMSVVIFAVDGLYTLYELVAVTRRIGANNRGNIAGGGFLVGFLLDLMAWSVPMGPFFSSFCLTTGVAMMIFFPIYAAISLVLPEKEPLQFEGNSQNAT